MSALRTRPTQSRACVASFSIWPYVASSCLGTRTTNRRRSCWREFEMVRGVIPRPGDQNSSQADPAFLRFEPTGLPSSRQVPINEIWYKTKGRDRAALHLTVEDQPFCCPDGWAWATVQHTL